MKWIALTGGLGSGKSTSAKIINEFGFSVVDADQLARETLKKGNLGFSQAISTFGQEILNEQGEIDRQKLGRMVFSNPVKLQQLEAIIHPLVREAAAKKRRELESKEEEIAFYDIPLLFEKKLQANFDGNVLIYANREKQIERISQREDWSISDIESRLANQVPMEEKKKLADYVIENTGSLADLKNAIGKVLQQIKQA